VGIADVGVEDDIRHLPPVTIELRLEELGSKEFCDYFLF
jgi:hypothetical protein